MPPVSAYPDPSRLIQSEHARGAQTIARIQFGVMLVCAIPGSLRLPGRRMEERDHANQKSTGRRRNLVAVQFGRDGADAARRARGSASMQARHCTILQSGPARPRSDQGLYEGPSSRAIRALQGGAFSGLAPPIGSTQLMGGFHAQLRPAR